MATLQKVLRPAACRAAFARQLFRPLSTTSAFRASVSNAPPRDPPAKADIGVGELEGAKFKIEPMRRVGEDDRTMRARLMCMCFLYSPIFLAPHTRHLGGFTKNSVADRSEYDPIDQSRKRGTLESDLLLSTFADAYLPQMTKEQMQQYDMFLDENDWDIYYWATQEVPSPANEAAAAPSNDSADTSSASYGSGVEAQHAANSATTTQSTWEPMVSPFAEAVADIQSGKTGKNAAAASDAVSEELYGGSGRTLAQSPQGGNVPPQPKNGEWAATVGTFKPAYRPVPARWRDSEVLRLLRGARQAAEQGRV
ncbi:Succinate dehydrogenase assembly factor 2 [Apiospora phragmitis]|uniref:Succinate dehydrogenase assembly factor 2 n=1 Tax=Apiospora phragmitis TaxID=2905665 RepID=A0ABR1TV34_9PEZI